ncbi:uncharacterized protein LOC116346047, partial [Contarinia nasturtii]|uniref:uncharacterized protein LOC116346047 n=1 Tax=Contarinia nasturtii TaxID=265458 RepID=UPI0012D3B1BC
MTGQPTRKRAKQNKAELTKSVSSTVQRVGDWSLNVNEDEDDQNKSNKRQKFSTGIGGDVLMTKKVKAFIKPWFNSNFTMRLDLYVVPSKFTRQPQHAIPNLRPYDKEMLLADDYFDTPNPVHILLGADVWAEVLRLGLYKHTSGAIMLTTALGNIILGKAIIDQNIEEQTDNVAVYSIQEGENEKLDEILQKFWKIEECVDDILPLTVEHKLIEQFYKKNYYRDKEGRYAVKIPFRRDSLCKLGESKNIVLRRFFQLEKRMQANVEFREKYTAKINEFIAKGYMVKAGIPNGRVNYIPHHAINKNKFKPVFDASCKTSTGESLNSIQMIGPKLQHDLHDQIMRFRRYKYAAITDIVSMFMQVNIARSQWDLQRIFWREKPSDPLQEYNLTVVTYGLASSVFVAVRTMIQCARDMQDKYPNAVRVIEQCFYMDDGLFGADTVEELKVLAREVQLVLAQGGFQLSKWASNSNELESLMKSNATKEIDIGDTTKEAKVLGIRWLKDTDELTIFVKVSLKKGNYTKRQIISQITKLYDPNGFVSPVVILAKMIMQDLWKHKALKWDDPVPSNLEGKWRTYLEELTILTEFRIPRWIKTKGTSLSEYHGFCDATFKAYGAVIYLKVIDSDGKISCTLLIAKSKVAPLKPITIPRMELLAALLLTRLMKKVILKAALPNAKYQLWSDSMVTLYWINKDPGQLKAFVANRVEEISSTFTTQAWAYVSTSDNPADLISRGMRPKDLIKHALWKEGPKWLKYPEALWPNAKCTRPEDELKEEIKKELKINKEPTSVVMMLTIGEESLFDTTNNWRKILRITAYCLRFIKNIKLKGKAKKLRIKSSNPTAEELRQAEIYWIKEAQSKAYPKEIQAFEAENQELPNKSKIRVLQPIFGSDGILRIGGRLDKAMKMPYTARHPAIIPPNSRLTNLLLRAAHEETLHGGPQMMMAYLRRRYWIPSLRSQARLCVNKCVKCIRYAKQTERQIMAELPAVRLNPARPFNFTGTDLAGPFNVKLSDKINTNTRGRTLPDVKGYIVVFVCLVTRSIHLEAVMDISADAFLLAYQRFVARRGNPEKMYSDHGTNFIASDRILKEAEEAWKNTRIQDFVQRKGTQWKFITPAAPHEGGIWEAAVKSMKHHLRRVIGPQKYSYEGISTLISGIEACLNSRPICAMSDDPKDTMALTPAHFLTGGPLKLPLPEETGEPPKTAKKLYNEIQFQTQSFWTKWHQDYIASLMQRPKWKEENQNLRPGQLVLIQNENLPPTYWAMARVIETFEGSDGK